MIVENTITPIGQAPENVTRYVVYKNGTFIDSVTEKENVAVLVGDEGVLAHLTDERKCVNHNGFSIEIIPA